LGFHRGFQALFDFIHEHGEGVAQRSVVTLSELIEKYGYVAVLIGTCLEGETVLVMAGFAAHQGHLALPGVMGAAFTGSLVGDQLAFFAGRRYGDRLRARFGGLRKGIDRAGALLDRHGTPLLLGFRFIYGIRTVTPLAAGMSGVGSARFLLLNVLGAALWAVSVGAAGYAFGHGLELLLERAHRFEGHVLLAMAAAGVIAAVGHHVVRKKRS
jgi:membrane protein DedA with SNARE-associated domain